MPDITREQLAAVLDGFHLWITPDHTQTVEASSVFGTVQDPESFADGLLLALRVVAAQEPQPERTDEHGGGRPDYYDGRTGMQPFDVIDEFGLDFYEGNCIKYLVRWRKKNGVEDLRKARTYLNRIIDRVESGSSGPSQ